MLSSHNMLNPQNGSPITLPSQDMVLGLYYLTKGKNLPMMIKVVKGEGKTFYSDEEVIIAYNEGKVDLHAVIKVRAKVEGDNGDLVTKSY
jgi:DNA-directed RNA polymerase subunit beta'